MQDDFDSKELPETLDRSRARNNSKNEPTGDCSGRCQKCGSRNLWTDNLTYGCNDCGEIYFRG